MRRELMMKREWKLMAGLVILGAAMTAFAVDTYPTEAWPADADVQGYNGTSESATGLDYIPRGTSATSTPPLQIRQHRRDKRVNDILAETNELRVVKESTALRIGVFPGDYVVNGTRTHFDGATSQGSGTLTAGDDTYYVYIDNANALQIVTDAAGWPADVTQFVPLAEVTVAGGAVTAIADRRGWARTIIPQTGGAAASGVDGTFFVLDQDNGAAGAATTQYRFNRGSTAADAGIGWNETDDLIDVLLDVTAPSAGVLRAGRFISTVATGTMPLQVTSTTLCLNLNADTLDGVGFSAAPAAANGVCYATSTAAAAFTAAPTAADVLYANGSGVPTWGALGATSGVQGYDADLTAVAALASTGLAARTAANTWAQRTITAGGSISVTNGDGVAGNPTVAVAGATQYAVQVGSSAGALSSIAVGSSNTVLCGNTGANPGFRQIVNEDVATGAAIAGAKITIPANSDVEYYDGKWVLAPAGVGFHIRKQLNVSAGSESSNKIQIDVSATPWTDVGELQSGIGVADVWLSDSEDGEITGTACTSAAVLSGQLLYTYTSGKMWKMYLVPSVISNNIEIEYTGGAKTWYLFIAIGEHVTYCTLAFS